MRLDELQEFTCWFEEQETKSRGQIEARLRRIQDHGYFGDSRDLGGRLAELRWKNGRRVYFSINQKTDGTIVVLILGGNKNGQSKDIQRARKILADSKK